MMMCPAAPVELGLIRDILGAVDCNVQVYALAGYQALTAPGSLFPLAVTGLLTIYVAVLGYQLMFAVGNVRLSRAPVIALEIGAVLAVTLNWGAFQTLVFRFDLDAPMEIARVIAKPMAGQPRPLSANLAADPLTGLQTAYDELTADGIEFGKTAGPSALPSRGGDAQAADLLWRASQALLASTAGVLAVSSIAVGVLTAIGPVFIVLFLFEATRGFFVGWVRALVAAMLAPLLCWVTTSLLLVVLEPWIDTLAEQRASHSLSLDTAASAGAVVLIFAAAQAALIVAGLVTAAGFRLGRPAPAPAPAANETGGVSRGAISVPAQPTMIEPAGARALALTRHLGASGFGPARDGGAATVTIARALADDPRGAPVAATRLGETYRRGNVMRDRHRFDAAGRA
jgi:type IV secretion system protein VirB6